MHYHIHECGYIYGRGRGRTEGLLDRPLLPSAVLAVELHAHSALSHDGRDPVELLLEQASAVGMDAIAVTDHDAFEASQAAVELAPEYDLVGIPAMEVTSAAGHVLAMGIEEIIPAGRPFLETLDMIHEAGGIAIVPHPFQKSRSGVAVNVSREELTRADAIEVYNSRLLTGRANRRARTFAQKHGMPQTAGSDAHIAEMVGQAVTAVDASEATAVAIVEAIAAGRTSVEGSRTPWRISFRQAAGGAKRRVKNRIRNLSLF